MEQAQLDTDANKQSGKAQHVRKRKKQYYKRIRQQMEFYFGDSNLSKDRFLNKLIVVNPYVSLDVFLKFNKIKEITTGIEDIQKALDGSEMLELSSDRQSVRRITEIRKKDDIDEYMVYVEALPPTATHETVRQQFKQFGNVAYVSLPKYRTNGRIKEFGFVEFEEKSSVAKCINAFRQFDGVIGDSHEPENLKSVVAYMKEQEELEKEEEEEEVEPKSQTDENEDEMKIESPVVKASKGAELQNATENDESTNSNIEENKAEKEANAEAEVKVDGSLSVRTVQKQETPPRESENTKDPDHVEETDRLPKIENKRVNEDPLSDTIDPPMKRLKTQESEEHQDLDDLGNTTDEKASVTDENLDLKPQK